MVELPATRATSSRYPKKVGVRPSFVKISFASVKKTETSLEQSLTLMDDADSNEFKVWIRAMFLG